MEVVQLEIDREKKKIGEEIIASQIIRRRELEAEVRMEIMMEEQIMGTGRLYRASNYVDPCMLMNNSYGFLGLLEGPSYFHKNLLNVGSSVDEFGKNVKLIGGIDDRLQIKNNVFGDNREKQQIHNEVELGKRPFEQDSSLVAAQVAGKYVAGVGGEEVLGQAMPSSGISGRKRKAETAVIVSDEETASAALQKKKWYCSLCGVSATSAGGMNLHLHGKKHKAKEAVTKSGDTINNISTDSYSIENSMQPMEQAVSQVHISKVQPMEEEKSQVQPMDEKKSLVTKKWECSLCQLSVTSEALLKSHLQGKKHKAKEAVTKSGDTASNISTDNYSIENSMQLMEPAVGQVQPMEQVVSQVQPMEQVVSQVQPMEEEKSQVFPVDEEKSQVQPLEEAKSKVRPTEEKKSLVTKKWECSLCQLSVTSETLLKSHLQGKKHKAKEAKLEVGQGMSDNRGEPANEKNVNAKKWYCSLCQVSAVSEKNLNDHFQGKKHKAKAGLADQEAGNVDSDLIAISKDEGGESLMTEQEKSNTNTRTEPGKSQVREQGIVNSLNTVKIGLEGGEAETDELEKSGYHSQEMNGKPVKLWHCKMCNEGTYDEATMANHRKSSKHMNMLREVGGSLIVVSNVQDEGDKGSQDAALE